MQYREIFLLDPAPEHRSTVVSIPTHQMSLLDFNWEPYTMIILNSYTTKFIYNFQF